jgi:hypothetical protein
MSRQGFSISKVDQLETAFIATYQVQGDGKHRTIGFVSE